MPHTPWCRPHSARLVPATILVVLLALALFAGAAVATAPSAAAGPPAAGPPVRYRPPVDARVVDPFRMSSGKYGPGNRGLEYGTAPGTAVRAAADGRVTFAGLVAGSKHVTVLHDDGVRTTYSFLDRIDVVVGQRVRRGDVVGTTAGHLHFSARRGDDYFDPATLFDDGRPHVYLVPFDDPPGPGSSGERSAIRQFIGGIGHAGRIVGRAATVSGQAAVAAGAKGLDWVHDRSGQFARTAFHYATRFWSAWATMRSFVAATKRAWDMARRPCTKASRVVDRPAARHAAVLVGGLGSSSHNAAVDDVDTAALGYDPADVIRYSYRGGHIPGGGARFASLPTSDYGPVDTEGDLIAQGRQLARLIDDVAAADPGVPIDLVAHSQGGIVARLALLDLAARHGEAWLDRLGVFATLATPHGGADLATAADAVNQTPLGGLVLDAAEGAVPFDADAVAVEELSETSDLMRRLRHHPISPHVRAVTIGGRTDLVVPVPRTKVRGATPVVVPITSLRAHDQLPGDPDTQRELALAVAGLPPACRSFAELLADEWAGESISRFTDAAGLVVAALLV